jgi:hypothetical protein
VLSVAALIYLFVGRSAFAKGKYKAFYRASCGVYVSGALLIFLFAFFLRNVPVIFVVVSNIAILFVFIFTVGLVYFMTKSIVEASSKVEVKSESRDGLNSDLNAESKNIIKNEESGNNEDK